MKSKLKKWLLSRWDGFYNHKHIIYEPTYDAAHLHIANDPPGYISTIEPIIEDRKNTMKQVVLEYPKKIQTVTVNHLPQNLEKSVICYVTKGETGLGVLQQIPLELRKEDYSWGFVYHSDLLFPFVKRKTYRFISQSAIDCVNDALLKDRKVYIFHDYAEFFEFARSHPIY